MAITRRTSNGVIETFSGTAGTGHTIDLSDAAIGDTRTVEISGNPDGTGTVGALTLPSGWSWAGTQTETGAASTGMLSVILRVVQSGDTLTGATLALTYDNSVMVASTAETWEGVDTGTPLDQTVPAYATGGSPPVSPSITTQTDGALLICAALVDGAPTWGDGDIPSGFTLNGTLVNNPPSNGQNHGSAYQIQATLGASGTKAWTNGGSEEYVAMTYALRPATAGITSVTPDDFDMDNSDVDVASTGDAFDASGNDVYLSDADTLAGSANEVDISSAINTEAVGLINLDFTQLSAGELDDLHTLGPGARYIIVDATGEEYSWPVTLHRPHAFVMSLGAGTNGATTARLAAPSGKTTGDFDAGQFSESANPLPAVNITADNYTELVWSQEAKPLARAVTYDTRVTKSGTPLDTYTVTPQVTISEGATAALTTVAATSAVGTVDKTLAKPLTGTASVGAVGSLDKVNAQDITGTEATSAEGTVGVTKSGSLEISGVSGVAAVGAVGFTEAGSVGLTGVAGTSAVGSLTVANRDIAVSGVGATTDVGTLVATAEIPLSGDPATGAVGSVEAGGDVIVPVTGVSSSAAVGSVGFTEAGSAGITGVQNAAAVGSLTVGNRDISLLGEAASSAVGSVQGERSIALDGVPATSQIGSISAAAAGSAGITGVEGPTAIGVFTAHHDVASSGIQSVAAAGNITSEISVTLTGIQATGQAGSVSVDANVTAALTGVQAVAGVGSFFFPGGAALQTYRGMMANVGRMMNG